LAISNLEAVMCGVGMVDRQGAMATELGATLNMGLPRLITIEGRD